MKKSMASPVTPIKTAFQSGEIIELIHRLDGIRIDPVRLHYYEKTGLIKRAFVLHRAVDDISSILSVT